MAETRRATGFTGLGWEKEWGVRFHEGDKNTTIVMRCTESFIPTPYVGKKEANKEKQFEKKEEDCMPYVYGGKNSAKMNAVILCPTGDATWRRR